MNVPEQLFAALERPTSHCLCLGLSVCEPLCLELYTTEALLVAEREIDRMRASDGAALLRAEIVRRHLLALRTMETLDRLDGFLSRFYGEADALRSALRGARGRPSAPSAIWSSEGQKFVRELAAAYVDDQGFLREALRGLRLDNAKGVVSVPLVVSVRDLVQQFQLAVRDHLRPGLCLWLRVEYDEEGAGERLLCPEQLRAVAATALRLAAQAEGEPPGRMVIDTPPVARLLPIEGGSFALPLYRAFRYLFASQELPADIALTGALDEAGRVMPVAGVEEKTRAALEGGIHRLFHPGTDAAAGSDANVAVRIEERTPAAFLREIEKSETPPHVRIANWLKLGLWLGLSAAWVASIRIWSVFYVSPEAVQSAFKELAPWQLIGEALYVGIGVPLQALLLFEPLLILILACWIASRYVECFVNWRKYDRWEPGLQPGNRDPAILSVQRRAAHELAVRRAFRFTLGWVCWSLGLTGTMFFYGFSKAMSGPPVGAGLLRWLVQIAMALGWLVLVLAVPAATLLLYRRVRSLAERRFSCLR